KADQGHILATTLDYPMVLDTVGCTPDFLKANPDAAKALADSYFDALELIKKDPHKSYEIMGADVKQSAKEFEDSAKYLKWADREENKQFFTKEFQDFSKTAAELLLQMGL
ncbi:ABC transporter permease, partial [bacterium M00.F.Ca.ET.177.01.1.1]